MNNLKVSKIGDAYIDSSVSDAVSGLIALPSVNIIYGDLGDLNALLLMDMSACVVKGIPWLTDNDGGETKPTAKMGVLWIDLDSDARRTRDRVRAVGAHYGLNDADSFYYITVPVAVPAGRLDLTNPAGIKDLEALIPPDVGMIVIDNLGFVIEKADENPHEVARVLSSFQLLAERKKVAFVILYTGDTLLDNISVKTAVDVTLHVEKNGHYNHVIINPTKTRGNQIPPFGAYFHSESSRTPFKPGWFEGMDAQFIGCVWEEENDDLILRRIASGSPFVLLYRDGLMEVFPLCDYIDGERRMLQDDSSYKTNWIPIGYGSYEKMQADKKQIEHEGLSPMDDCPF